jgi:cellulose synthase/poly-beta-1,6-N-acetylglucosamine synthase-like glycosyltransferase
MLELISSIVNWIGLIAAWTILIYFIYTVSYSLILSLSAFMYRLPDLNKKIAKARIAVLIPAYKEDEVIIAAALQAINHNYPSDKFDVVVIADSLHKETLDQLDQIERLIVVKVEFDKSTKVKALNEALSKLDTTYDIGVILDADNLMHEGFLFNISSCYTKGHLAIQGQRVAKNKGTAMAFLDAVSEAINNHIYRQGTTALGLSCSFIGSGMAIDFNLMKSTLSQMDSVGGFDRDMEVRLIGKGYKVYYLKNAIVYDEKVENTKVFANQRKRWIYSQYRYLLNEFMPGLKNLFKGDIVYFNSSVLRNIQLPRLINLGLLFITVLFSIFFPAALPFLDIVWLGLLVLLVFSILIAIPRSFYNKDLLYALLSLPKVFVIMFLLLFKLKGSNKTFIHTPHGNLNK